MTQCKHICSPSLLFLFLFKENSPECARGIFLWCPSHGRGDRGVHDNAVVLELKRFGSSSLRPGLWLLLPGGTGRWEGRWCKKPSVQVQVFLRRQWLREGRRGWRQQVPWCAELPWSWSRSWSLGWDAAGAPRGAMALCSEQPTAALPGLSRTPRFTAYPQK